MDSNKPINIQGDPFPFINKLTVNPNQAALFDLREEQLSSLTPRIRLFKSEYNNNYEEDLIFIFIFRCDSSFFAYRYIKRMDILVTFYFVVIFL